MAALVVAMQLWWPQRWWREVARAVAGGAGDGCAAANAAALTVTTLFDVPRSSRRPLVARCAGEGRNGGGGRGGGASRGCGAIGAAVEGVQLGRATSPPLLWPAAMRRMR